MKETKKGAEVGSNWAMVQVRLRKGRWSLSL